MNPSVALRVAAALGFLAVALGAFGAHGLREVLAATGRAEEWKTAVVYHLVHAVLMTALSLRAEVPKLVWSLFAVGIVVFSGSLYVLALTNVRWLGAITPLGGLSLLAGWLLLMLRPFRASA